MSLNYATVLVGYIYKRAKWYIYKRAKSCQNLILKCMLISFVRLDISHKPYSDCAEHLQGDTRHMKIYCAEHLKGDFHLSGKIEFKNI